MDVPLLSLMNLEGIYINVLKLGDFEDDLKKSLLEMKYTNYYRSSCFTDLYSINFTVLFIGISLLYEFFKYLFIFLVECCEKKDMYQPLIFH